MDEFSGWLKERRKALGLSQAALGDCAGCAVITVKKLESGDRRPSRELALRLAQCLGLSPNEHDDFVRFARGETSEAKGPQDPPSRAAAPPAILNSFVGRDRELETLERLLIGDQRRLVTILGPPGVGKTRLVLQACLALQGGYRPRQRYRDGVRWVDLSPLHEPETVAFTIRRTLALPESPLPWRSDLDQIVALLAEQHLLLVLDNCEQVGDMKAVLDTLLAGIAGLSIVATSRQPLNVYGEQVLPIAPLPVAGPAAWGPGQLSPAAALFLARAGEVAPGYVMGAEDTALVEALCRRLDGLPLAIELGAAQLRYRSLPSVLDQVGIDALDLSWGPSAAAPTPPMTLRAVIERSLHLLTPTQQQLLACLSVFINGWSAEAAVVFGSRKALDRLVEASLVQLDRGGPDGERYSMLEATRAFAAERLELMGARSTVRAAHAGYYARLAGKAAEEMHSPALPGWQLRLALEGDNFDAALAWCLARDVRLGLEIAVHLWNYWYLWGAYRSGVAHLAAFLEPNPARDLLRARALRATGVLLTRQAKFAEAEPHFVECLQIASEVGDQFVTACAHMGLGDCQSGTGDWLAARPHYEIAHQKFVGLGHALGRSWALGGLSKAALMVDEDTVTAGNLMADCVLYARAAGDPRHLGWMLSLLADFQREVGKRQEAHETLAEAVDVMRDLGDTPGLAYAYLRLGAVYREERRTRLARDHLLQALDLATRSHTPSYVRQALSLLALLIIGEGDDALGTQMIAASLADFPRLRSRLPAPDRRDLDNALEELPRRMGQEAFSANWEQGQALTLSRARALMKV